MPDGPWVSSAAADEAAEQEAILAEEIATGMPGLPPDELAELLADPDRGLPEGADAWLEEPASLVRGAIPGARSAADAAVPASSRSLADARLPGAVTPVRRRWSR